MDIILLKDKQVRAKTRLERNQRWVQRAEFNEIRIKKSNNIGSVRFYMLNDHDMMGLEKDYDSYWIDEVNDIRGNPGKYTYLFTIQNMGSYSLPISIPIHRLMAIYS